MYCAKYCLEKDNPQFAHLEPQFSLMSRNPGIGSTYVEKFKDWHNNDDDKLYCVTTQGRKISIPRFYRDKIFSSDHVFHPYSPVKDDLSPQDRKLRAISYTERLKRRSKIKSRL